MTTDRMALIELLEKTADADFLREMLGFVPDRLMALEAEGLCGAAPGGAAPIGRTTVTATGIAAGRRGPARWTCVSRSSARAVTSLPSSSRVRRAETAAEKALVAVVQEAYVQSVSTRSVDELVKAMGMTGISKSQVSRLCAEIDERVSAFLERPIEGFWPYLWLDATYVKVRRSGRIVSAAVIVAVGANTEGRREILGLTVGPSEAEPFWTDFLRTLANRGLRGVKLVIADAHLGLRAAVDKVLSATVQRCRVHFMRNALAHVPKGQREMVAAAIRTAFVQEDVDAASRQWRQVADSLRPRFEKLAQLMDEAETDVLAFMGFPREHRTKIHSTNPLERVNKEIKRRTNVVGIFPNGEAIVRLVGAILIEQNDE